MAHFLGMFEMPNDILGQLIIYIVVLLFAISAHEAAHAWMSHRFGDDTAYLLGRVTLNPVKHTDLANIMVSLAGIMANITIATATLILIKVYQHTSLSAPDGPLGMAQEPVVLFLRFSLIMNTSLAVFNLLPFPPLDGSKVLYSFLPASAEPFLLTLERYGFIILMAFIYFGFFGVIFAPVGHLLEFLISL